jgi:glycosyltransferase involved in cell wall biosynthesis
VPDLVSILIPAYNAEKWIKQTIGSALYQTWGNKEIVVIDDGSTDRTLDIAKTFETNSVKVVSQNNRGAASARNKALSLASGDYIQWLDADDLLAPNKIAEQMKAAEGERSNLILYSSPHGVFYFRHKRARFVPNPLWQDLSPVDWLVMNLADKLWMNPAGWLVSRELTEKAGPWDERLTMDDDGEYFARIVAASERVKFVWEARCYYRQSGFQQLSKRITDKARDSLLLSSQLRIRTLLSLEDSERTKRAGAAFLQARLPVFYPENKEAFRKMNALALDLGGVLTSPKFGRRTMLLQKILGPKKGKELIIILRRLRMAAAVRWDELMYKLGR